MKNNECAMISTVGFDEKLVIRSMLKLGIKEEYDIILVYSLSGGEYEQKKVKNAVESIKNILTPLGVNVSDINLPAEDIVFDVGIIVDELKKRKIKKITALLVGGMRILITEVLIALTLYKYFINPEANVKIYIMREDGLYGVLLPLEVFHPSRLTEKELLVLRTLCKSGNIERSKFVSAVSRTLGTSESLIYKIINSLEEKGAVEVKGGIIKLTVLGAILCKIT